MCKTMNQESPWMPHTIPHCLAFITNTTRHQPKKETVVRDEIARESLPTLLTTEELTRS